LPSKRSAPFTRGGRGRSRPALAIERGQRRGSARRNREIRGPVKTGRPPELVSLCVVDLDGDNTSGIGVGKRLHQDIFDDAEYGGRGANAESEGDSGNYCKRGETFGDCVRPKRMSRTECVPLVPPLRASDTSKNSTFSGSAYVRAPSRTRK